MQNSVIRWVVILGTVALIGIIATQAYWVRATWDLNEDEFNKKVNLALYRVAKDLAKFNSTTLPPRDIVKQRSSNYWVVNVEVEIDDKALEHYLHKELQNLALNADFEYAVFDCHTDEMVYGGFHSFSPDNNEGPDLTLGDLPKDQEFTYYFGVKFPERQGYLFDKMQLIFFLSVILLVTIIFFAYALWVILRQKQLSEMQKDFINNMTHEFKTPLSTIKIAAGVFLNDDHVRNTPRLHRYADILLEQNERLTQQVEKVLHIARIEKGGLEIKQETVDLCELISSVVDSSRVQVEALQGQLLTNIHDFESVKIKADPLHLTNILYNLLDNAVKYRRDTPPVVQILLEEQGGYLTLAVKDNGIGIAPAQARRVFDKFYRVPTGNVHNVKGFGLGLFYVKRICKAHQWKIHVVSTLGEGTSVFIRLGEALALAYHKDTPFEQSPKTITTPA